MAMSLTLFLAVLAAPAADKAQPAVPDVARLADPGSVRLDGWVGERLMNCEKNRLLKLDEDRLLRGFRKKPGEQAWIGEHVGKWLHAASLAYEYTKDPALREKLDRVVKGLLDTQEPDGYLGTYVKEQRFGQFPSADWDVWVHKYCIIGLLAYHHATGDEAALAGAKRAADLLIATFGPAVPPGGSRGENRVKSILSAGTHVGMAATSVLEPIVQLYFRTGEAKYLDFGKYIVSAYDEPKGPAIVKSLLEHGSVRKTANAKAYEMMSNLVGLCELYRATGEKSYLKACENAWSDIVQHRMYITAGLSLGEHFMDDGFLPNTGAVSETCATVTWEQLNIQLLRITGDAKYAVALEGIVLNHLLAAQDPDGSGFCYFTPLEGKKPYDDGINCCTSSGSRGLFLIPTFALMTSGDEVLVNLPFIPAKAEMALVNGEKVKVELTTDFPSGGKFSLKVADGKKAVFGVRDLRWKRKEPGAPPSAEYTRMEGISSIEVSLPLDLVSFAGGPPSNAGRAALKRGPQVYCLEPHFNPEAKGLVALAGDDAKALGLESVPAPAGKAYYPGQVLVKAKGVVLKAANGRKAGDPVDLYLYDYANAGADGGKVEVWLPLASSFDLSKLSLFSFGEESWSREGNAGGRISDGDASSFRVTFDGQKVDEDWFAVEVADPVEVARVAFVQGGLFHDGGWFDAAQGKPRVQVKREKTGKWETVATIDDYPATTATDRKGLRQNRRFEVKLATPVRAVAIRVIGAPASGDNAAQAFSSCAELEAFGK